MSKIWDYAELSKSAKAAGTPEKLIQSIKDNSYRQGQLAEKAKQNPKLFIAVSIAALAAVGAVKLIDVFKKEFNKNKFSNEEAIKAEQILVQQIKLHEVKKERGLQDMKKCEWCGSEFSLSGDKDEFNSYFNGKADYDDQYPKNNVCFACALESTSADVATGEETIELMGTHDWESDN